MSTYDESNETKESAAIVTDSGREKGRKNQINAYGGSSGMSSAGINRLEELTYMCIISGRSQLVRAIAAAAQFGQRKSRTDGRVKRELVGRDAHDLPHFKGANKDWGTLSFANRRVSQRWSAPTKQSGLRTPWSANGQPRLGCHLQKIRKKGEETSAKGLNWKARELFGRIWDEVLARSPSRSGFDETTLVLPIRPTDTRPLREIFAPTLKVTRISREYYETLWIWV
ncbi:hypothetical protein B0H11DRAFT_1927919 [Mycena galericulata]|nr:hypothetical protein B0H11DRAFT_1927919 [Mycena galericulata]